MQCAEKQNVLDCAFFFPSCFNSCLGNSRAKEICVCLFEKLTSFISEKLKQQLMFIYLVCDTDCYVRPVWLVSRKLCITGKLG